MNSLTIEQTYDIFCKNPFCLIKSTDTRWHARYSKYAQYPVKVVVTDVESHYFDKNDALNVFALINDEDGNIFVQIPYPESKTFKCNAHYITMMDDDGNEYRIYPLIFMNHNILAILV